jgi:hypothetical protein
VEARLDPTLRGIPVAVCQYNPYEKRSDPHVVRPPTRHFDCLLPQSLQLLQLGCREGSKQHRVVVCVALQANAEGRVVARHPEVARRSV